MGSSEDARVIAVVDDDQLVRSSMENLLRSLGLKARTFASAEDFLAVGEQVYDCLITDLQMPGMSGMDLQHIVSSWNAPLPTIVMSAFPERGGEALDAGAVCFISKPVDGDQLVSCLESVLGSLE